MSDAPASRPLSVLRAGIDALDRELLQLMARRMALVAEVAAYKRAHALAVRDPAREREVLADRARDAAELGLPVGEVEAIFRLLLRASREHQAALRAGVAPGEPPRTVAVIGGHGRIGALMARLFGDLGHRVLVCDLDTALRPEEAAASADVTVVSVPIDATDAVIRAVGPHVPDGGLLMDVTSVKQAPVRAMLEATRASVVGTHPMFGPSVHSLQGQRLVLCRARGDGWADWAARAFAARGLVVTEAEPAHHDRVMAIVQVLTHFQTQVLGLTIARAGLPLAETLRFTSPAYLLELFVTARHFAQSPALYGPLEMRNPDLAHVTDAFRGAAAELAEVLRGGDQAAFEAVFAEVRAFFGDFTATALEQSSHLIDRIVERS
ncbi:bifunctional chorismate mutase/prephenate dehydrogenase [Roseisolibacter sp. H3M3-2]|uniref:bifunctional chorismate mutase/prephenate dehydrogenase n=1 Tax=Roseisolibacter sp. H3M3-2 TaxID=3031323 RepID=UPI0023DC565F|nr:bifunctional chorismate mutase/prephenate dehydrogenase [Roseisolibacter sp. H3M3-2]MDF1505395.1 bifunctional chorismate mutase/prephenate dehydrogenase [Roseisolibacter sp. H3M3-2]